MRGRDHVRGERSCERGEIMCERGEDHVRGERIM